MSELSETPEITQKKQPVMQIIVGFLLGFFNLVLAGIVTLVFAVSGWCLVNLIDLKLEVTQNKTNISEIIKDQSRIITVMEHNREDINEINATRFKLSDAESLKELIRNGDESLSKNLNQMRESEIQPLQNDVSKLEESFHSWTQKTQIK